jgi:hypothetical protein
MGTCEFSSKEEFPDLNKMTMSKFSTGDNYMEKSH